MRKEFSKKDNENIKAKDMCALTLMHYDPILGGNMKLVGGLELMYNAV